MEVFDRLIISLDKAEETVCLKVSEQKISKLKCKEKKWKTKNRTEYPRTVGQYQKVYVLKGEERDNEVGEIFE